MKPHRKFLRIVPLVLLLAVFLAQRAGLFRTVQPHDRDLQPGSRHACTLLEIVDGDTIVIRWQGRTEHLRLLRINTPERSEPGYEESAEFLRNLLEGKKIEVEFEDPAFARRDNYGRLLAYVFADGENVNVEMVRAGCSPYWTKYGRGKYAEAFENAQSEARGAARGSPEAPTESSPQQDDASRR